MRLSPLDPIGKAGRLPEQLRQVLCITMARQGPQAQAQTAFRIRATRGFTDGFREILQGSARISRHFEDPIGQGLNPKKAVQFCFEGDNGLFGAEPIEFGPQGASGVRSDIGNHIDQFSESLGVARLVPRAGGLQNVDQSAFSLGAVIG